MTNEEISEAKIFALAAPVVLPLIQRRKKVAIECLMRDFKEGRTDNTARVAELTVLADLERDILNKEQLYHTLEEQNANRKR